MEVKIMVNYELIREKDQTIGYGIRACENNKTAIILHDVFLNYSDAKYCVELFNKEQLELVHLEQVVEDFLRFGTV